MKNHTEKPPIDDLFARKIGNMSLQPGADAWETLQARLGNSPVRRMVPVWYRYAAVAASLLIVGTVGWLYKPIDTESPTIKNQIASVRKRAEFIKPTKPHVSKPIIPTQDEVLQLSSNETDQVPVLTQAIELPNKNQHRKKEVITITNAEETGVANVKTEPVGETQLPKVVTPMELSIAQTAQSPALKTVSPIESKVSDNNTDERTLVVTIAIPKVLVNNQTANQKNESLISALTAEKGGKEEKANKAARFLRKLKQLKEGDEAFAYNDKKNDEDEESGLISRLYGNVKHSIDSKKTDKR